MTHIIMQTVQFMSVIFFFQAEDGIRDIGVTGVQTCAFFFSSRRRHTRYWRDWSSDVCSSDLSRLLSGKTWFAHRLLAGVPRLVVIDPKATLIDWGLTEPGADDWTRLERGGTGRFRILAPIVDDPLMWYESLFQRLYDIGDLTVYIDEAYA